MAGTLTWAITPAFTALVDHAEKNSQHIMLVKDHGVYLASPGSSAKDTKVVYAKGFNPEVDEFDDWYDRAHDICGGDDFVEHLNLDFFRKIIKGGAKTFKVKLTARKMSLEASA